MIFLFFVIINSNQVQFSISLYIKTLVNSKKPATHNIHMSARVIAYYSDSM